MNCNSRFTATFIRPGTSVDMKQFLQVFEKSPKIDGKKLNKRMLTKVNKVSGTGSKFPVGATCPYADSHRKLYPILQSKIQS